MPSLLDALIGTVANPVKGEWMAGLGNLGDVLGTPGAMVTSAINGVNPLEAAWDLDKRKYGRDFLEKHGIADENTDGLDWGDVGGFAIDTLLDPTNLVGAGLLKRLIGKSKPNWFHATPHPSVGVEELLPKPGRALREPTAVYFSSSPEDALHSTGRSPTRVLGARIDPRSTISHHSPEYTDLNKQAMHESEGAARASGLGDYMDSMTNQGTDRSIEAIEQALSHTAHKPQDRITEMLRSRGYDSVSSQMGPADWLMVLDPSIVKSPHLPKTTLPLAALLAGMNVASRNHSTYGEPE